MLREYSSQQGTYYLFKNCAYFQKRDQEEEIKEGEKKQNRKREKENKHTKKEENKSEKIHIEIKMEGVGEHVIMQRSFI